LNWLIAALFSPWIALAGRTRKILLAIALLDIPLQIDQNFGWQDEAAELGAIAGFNISVTTLALLGLYAGWFVERVVSRDRSTLLPIALVLPLGLYVLVSVLSIAAASDIGLYSRGLFLLLQMFFLFLYIVGTSRSEQDVRFVVMWLLGGLVLESAIMMGMGIAGEGFRVAGMTARVDADEFGSAYRFGGTVGSPITAAAYLEVLLAPALVVFATASKRYDRMLAAAGFFLGSVALVATLSRGAWLASLLSLAIVCASLLKGRRLPPIVPVALMVGLLVVGVTFRENITARLTGDDGNSARGRVPLMLLALDIIEDNPVLGVGTNNYTAAIEPRLALFGNEWLFTVHNQYLLVWAETGIVGLAAFLFFLLVTLRRGWRAWKRSDPYLAPVALGFTAALMGQMVHMQVDIFGSRAVIQLLFVIAALICVITRLESRRPAAQTMTPTRAA
jgi:hypothetical protein